MPTPPPVPAQPVWQVGYQAGNYSNNNFGSFATPNMQATLNAPHNSVLYVPLPTTKGGTGSGASGGSGGTTPILNHVSNPTNGYPSTVVNPYGTLPGGIPMTHPRTGAPSIFNVNPEDRFSGLVPGAPASKKTPNTVLSPSPMTVPKNPPTSSLSPQTPASSGNIRNPYGTVTL